MVKGTKKESQSTERVFHIGLTKVQVVAVCPTRSQLNALLGREDQDDDKELDYLSTDKEDNPRARLTFWLYAEALARHIPYSFNIVKKIRLNKVGDKAQVINATLGTSWVPYDAETEQVDMEALPAWFSEFQDKQKNTLADKEVRPALLGEEELALIMRTWLGRLNFNSTDANALLDTDKFFEGDFSELQSLIDSDFDTSMLATLGVKTDPDDSSKQYQQVYKTFLPESFMKDLDKGFKGSHDYVTKTWDKFEKEITGEYGFNAYFELEPAKVYNSEDDPNVDGEAESEATDTNSKFA